MLADRQCNNDKRDLLPAHACDRLGPPQPTPRTGTQQPGRSESGTRAVESALAEVFPWARHLSAAERTEFTAELIAALSDAAELTIDQNAHEVVAGWRATARIKADTRQYARTEGDFGPAEVTG